MTKKMAKKVKNIGIEVDLPSQKCEDKNCPFHGSLKIRGKSFTGFVRSSKMNRSAVIEWERTKLIRKYERYLKRKTRVVAHNPTCINAVEGDVVKIFECRPLSKRKNYVIVEKLGATKEFVTKEQLYEVEERKEKEKKAKLEEKEIVKGKEEEQENESDKS